MFSLCLRGFLPQSKNMQTGVIRLIDHARLHIGPNVSMARVTLPSPDDAGTPSRISGIK